MFYLWKLTFARVAYGFTANPDEIFSITDWPGARGRTVPKVPTTLKYNDDGTFTWGYELDPSASGIIEGVKLLLDPDQPKVTYVPTSNSRAELRRLGKPAVDVASDYMGAIYRHATSKLKTMYPQSFIDMLDTKFVLSVPALWSDKAQHATLKVSSCILRIKHVLLTKGC